MKKLIRTIIIMFIIVSIIPILSFPANTIGVILNGSPIQFNDNSGYPFIDNNNRTLVPLRKTMEAAGYIVFWDLNSQTASVSDNNGKMVYVKIGENFITKEINNNGSKEIYRLQNDSSAQIVNGRTYLPMRVVLESFGATVSWDNYLNSVIVNNNRNNLETKGLNEDKYTAEEIYEKYSQSVFLIITFDSSDNPIGSGSGFFIDTDGTAITNFHVIEGAYYAKIMTTDGSSYDVEGVKGYDEKLDIAKIKIHGSNFKKAELEASGENKGGSIVYAIGSPLGLDNTISEGIISNPRRVLMDRTYYQITTPISHGSSGGALFNEKGKVIGITSAGIDGAQNINLAIPISDIFLIEEIPQVRKINTLPNNVEILEVSLLLSKESVSLNVDEVGEVLISYLNYDKNVGAEYVIGNANIVNANWGNWNGNKIPLSINAVNSGETNILINLYDDTSGNLLATKNITVVVSNENKIQYYSGYYPAPDFGKIMEVPLYYEFKDENSHLYYYSSRDLNRLYPNQEFISYYSDLLTLSGFTYDGNFYDNQGNLVLRYRNYNYNIGIYTTVSNLGAELVYTIFVFKN